MPQTALTAYSPNEKTLASIFMEKPMPKLVAFDLDYTLWDLWIDTHVSPPLRRPKESTLNRIVDAYGTPIELYPQVASILHKLHEKQTHIAAASRTSAPDLALQALAQLLVPPPSDRPRERPQRAIDFFESLEIYPGSKRIHFSELHKKTGIPYSEMVFFDDEERNREVELLGVTFILVKDGLNDEVFQEGLKEWRRRRGFTEDDESDDEGSGSQRSW
ncbi:hypothetical protein FRC02_009420 [Tulasnella sp. 418]|nr:hypothetical protein FRC02_009420 [Tulasnella sp. 418]